MSNLTSYPIYQILINTLRIRRNIMQQARLFLLFSLISVLLAPSMAVAQTTTIAPEAKLSVSIYNPEKTQAWSLNYSEPARLSQVISDSITTQMQNNLSIQGSHFYTDQIYWPGSSLTTGAAPQNKSTVLKAIDQLVDKEPTSFALKASLRANERWIANNILHQRELIPLDFDAIRLNRKLNPLLNGEYHLYLPNRPSDILVIGATQKPTLLRWQPRLSARNYLDKTALIDNHQKDYAAVIQPDGTVEQHPIAYWNKNHMDIAPGATIYIGYNDLPGDYLSLNQEMIKLLRNKVL
ncbi:capsule biosynthesis GfcC family protein [Photobacterium sp. DA100]|uniref:capsule biosynthesis GfcC family protein n=1 Tax=Photobacterium sp. DA100 TaxID=3027472 RepID=UPI00247AC8EF|nr:capsule biosynthesis GfcC family protein [Photobacterium sp. DA100]WEM41583.1 capsule biosynthesis GfcC family protein [Photobacterium sp. DA100]